MSGNLLARTLSRASFTEALGEEALVRAMLAFESALALSQAEAGVIPARAAKAIEAACGSVKFSFAKLAADGKSAGALAIPVVKGLTEHVRGGDAKAASFVHYGSTSQDVLDTALVLCMQPCVAEIDRVLGEAVAQLADHARRNASAVMLGRTMMQPATPITAGIKIARWAASLSRCRARIADAANRALCVQLGGPVGTLDALGTARAAVRGGVARRLGIADARSWHSHRDEMLSFASALAILVATVGKIARDVALMSQPEVGEMLESAPKKGVGGSSAMPHKRNPVACMQAIAAATRAPGLMATLLHGSAQEHERAIGGWQAELATLPELMETAGASLDAIERIAGGLVVNPARMRQNLDALQGLVYSERLSRLLMKDTDRAAAMSQVDDWCTQAAAESRTLMEVVSAARPELPLDAVFSAEAVVSELAPVLEEELAAL
ncbi:MAG: 3-carboxy-cis,cis-muconate cycloisomerase [Proteobacteria bacterium]|nr:3-carboxy-cis,cis-muconate cycloisomerase [Pseudomonadota bacterium]